MYASAHADLLVSVRARVYTHACAHTRAGAIASKNSDVDNDKRITLIHFVKFEIVVMWINISSAHL